jgi:hypothetical protein
MEDHAKQNEKIMVLLTRIDERSLNTLDQLTKLNSKVASHELAISSLQLTDAEQKGEAKSTARFSGALWGVASSVLSFAIMYAIGIRK